MPTRPKRPQSCGFGVHFPSTRSPPRAMPGQGCTRKREGSCAGSVWGTSPQPTAGGGVLPTLFFAPFLGDTIFWANKLRPRISMLIIYGGRVTPTWPNLQLPCYFRLQWFRSRDGGLERSPGQRAWCDTAFESRPTTAFTHRCRTTTELQSTARCPPSCG